MAKVITKICNLISILMVLVVIAVGAVMIVPKVMGNEIYAVLSGSMEPYYHVGSVVIVDTHVSPEEIQVGDPITFRKGDNAIATHRVIAVNSETEEFRTKGDANEDEDVAPVPYGSLIGKAGMSVPMIGYIPLYMRTKKGMFCIGAYIIVFILLQIIPELVKPEKEEKQSDEKHN